ncbi:MAG: tetratricopeptide repeat protein [Halobacteriota archaeon]
MSELDEIEDLLKKGEEEKAFGLIKDKDTNSLAEGLIERGSSLIENEEYDFAITYFEFLEKIATDGEIKENVRKHLTDAYNNRGTAYGKKGEFDRAIEDFDKVIELNPEYASAYYNRGLTYSNLKRDKEAIADYNKAIELDPKYAYAYNNRGTAYRNLKRDEEAIADYNKAIELNPNFAYAYNNRGTAYSNLKKYEEALEDYNKAVELDPNFAMAYNNRGVAYYKLEKYRKAKGDYNKAIELDQNFDKAHANLGDSLFMKEDYDNAEKECREAIKINKNLDYAHNSLGLVLSKRKAYKDAIAEFKKALELNNKDADFYNNLGCAYAEYGKGSAIAPFSIFKAKNKLRKATREKNTYVEAHKNLTIVGDLLNSELKIFLLRIFIIFFVIALSINLFDPITFNRWILILTGVATLSMVLFSLDFTKIEIKSLKIAGVEAELNYEKPKAGEKAVQFAKPR